MTDPLDAKAVEVLEQTIGKLVSGAVRLPGFTPETAIIAVSGVLISLWMELHLSHGCPLKDLAEETTKAILGAPWKKAVIADVETLRRRERS
jgi:hypothetical protein